ncbi:unnamed protein product, partial [Tuber aestivum]
MLLLHSVLQGSYFTFLNLPYEQRTGLTMGIPCSPEIANLYAALYEQEGPTKAFRERKDVLRPFLDLDLIVLSNESRVDYKLFQKPLNHYMRIPWDSFHPLAVKKAGYIRELTQIATCSSKRDYYDAAILEYVEILVARGCPPQGLHSW